MVLGQLARAVSLRTLSRPPAAVPLARAYSAASGPEKSPGGEREEKKPEEGDGAEGAGAQGEGKGAGGVDDISKKLKELNARTTIRSTVLEDSQGFSLASMINGGFGLLSWWNHWHTRSGLQIIQSVVEKSFDEDDFIEGAEDAFITVYEMLGQEEAEGLDKMASKRMCNALKQMKADYDQQGITMRMSVVNIRDVKISGVKLFSHADALGYLGEDAEPAAAAEHVGGAAAINDHSGWWLMVSVDIKSEERCELYNKDGHAVDDITDRRGHTWRFMRGPLPRKLPVEELDLPWVLADIQ